MGLRQETMASQENVAASSCNWITDWEYIVRLEVDKDVARKPPALFKKEEIPVARGPGRG